MSETAGLIVFGFMAVYITACLVWLDGPFDVFYQLRALALTRNPRLLGKMFDCPWCAGFWAGLLCAVLAVLALEIAIAWALPLGTTYAAIAGLLLEDKDNGALETQD